MGSSHTATPPLTRHFASRTRPPPPQTFSNLKFPIFDFPPSASRPSPRSPAHRLRDPPLLGDHVPRSGFTLWGIHLVADLGSHWAGVRAEFLFCLPHSALSTLNS